MDTLLALDENVKQIPNMKLSQYIYSYEYYSALSSSSSSTLNLNNKIEELKDKILNEIENDSMTPLYISLCNKYLWNINEDKLNIMRFIYLLFSFVLFL